MKARGTTLVQLFFDAFTLREHLWHRRDLMAPMAANLSDQDIEDLAAWYASQEGLKDLSIK